MFSTSGSTTLSHVAETRDAPRARADQLAGDPVTPAHAWCASTPNAPRFRFRRPICYTSQRHLRLPKPAAGSTVPCDPQEEASSNPASLLLRRRPAPGSGVVPICSNAITWKIYYDGRLLLEADADRKDYPNLKYPPFYVAWTAWRSIMGRSQNEGYIQGKLAATKTLSGSGTDDAWW